jgi:glyoxylase-like metal-dependent hydrolase (beta-lactamase superfamily II)
MRYLKNLCTTLLLSIFIFISACKPVIQLNESKHFDLVEISEGVYACIHKFGGKAISNAGIIDLGDGTLIFDTFLSPLVAAEIPEIVKKLGLPPIEYVVNSHYHNDHIRGNQVFSDDIQIISTSRTAQLIAEMEPQELAAEKEYAPSQLEHYDSLMNAFAGDTLSREYKNLLLWQPYFETLVETNSIVETRLPDTYFEDEMIISGSKREVTLISMGRGHTDSDAVLYLPDEKILFASDLLFIEMHPYMADGHPDDLYLVLNKLLEMDVETVVPGHGPVGGPEDLEILVDYLKTANRAVADLIENGGNQADISTIQIPEQFSDWWFESFYYSNLRFLYAKHTEM